MLTAPGAPSGLSNPKPAATALTAHAAVPAGPTPASAGLREAAVPGRSRRRCAGLRASGIENETPSGPGVRGRALTNMVARTSSPS